MTQTEPNERVAMFPVTRLKPLDSNKKTMTLTSRKPFDVYGFSVNIVSFFLQNARIHLCYQTLKHISQCAMDMAPMRKTKKTSAPKLSHLLVDDFDILVVQRQSSCVPDLAIPFSVVFCV